jgi:peptidoglycan-associated lipoprotein
MMNTYFRISSVAFLATAVFAAGCAKREMVKQEESIPVAVPAKPAAPAASTQTRPAVAAQPVKSESPSAASSSSSATAGSDTAAALEAIYFDFDSYTLSPASRKALAGSADILKQRMSKVRIEGNCDERGSDEYNLALGERRAKAAMKYLVTMGVGADRLSVISYGKEKPVERAHTEEAWAKNRRDDFLILK